MPGTSLKYHVLKKLVVDEKCSNEDRGRLRSRPIEYTFRPSDYDFLTMF